MIYLLFFLSGFSGLLYQVVWVRVFGNVFGNTVYSAALVVAVFMLGLGLGSYAVGAWADREYARRPAWLLRGYGYIEIAIGALGLGISMLLPHLDRLAAQMSSYTPGGDGWWVLSTMSHVARAGIAVVLLAPVTVLMGGTLTLLIRHLVRSDVESGAWRIALLYAVNTAGAALGCLLTDFSLVPSYGLRNTQMIAVACNVLAGVGALWIARGAARLKPGTTADDMGRLKPGTTRERKRAAKEIGSVPLPPGPGGSRIVILISLALFLAGFAAMGMEILWFRHFTIMLGQFRAVFSLLLALILVGIGVGSLAAGIVQRRTAAPAVWFMATQALFVAFALLGLYLADSSPLDARIAAAGAVAETNFEVGAGAWTELWFNAGPMLLEVALPALLMGFSFPLANAIVQHAERAVGSRAGLLYLTNTVGAVAGSLAAGFLLLPALGIQGTAAVLMIAAALAIVPLAFSASSAGSGRHADAAEGGGSSWLPAAACLLLAAAAVGSWLLLPGDFLIARALPKLAAGERQLTIEEGVNEVIGVVETRTGRRTLMTNGHAMSSTLPLSQRYMRALAHVPLLAMDNPQTALVIGFGVGNTTHAASLHPSMRRIEIADLSRDILEHAAYFGEFNKDVLRDPRVAVHVNDGRQHLQMQAPGTYDLITLEPPPIAYAGVAALYSREFYALASSRLTPHGYASQWLPAYQVPTATTLAMVRAFIDVFPAAVLLSGAEADLLLLGARDGRVEIDPARLAAHLAAAPAVRADMERLNLGTVTEIAGMFVGSARTLADATRQAAAVTDDRPIQEYGVLSLLNFGQAVPAAIVNLDDVGVWCPGCFVNGRPAPLAGGLDAYMALLKRAYAAPPRDVRGARLLQEREGRTLAGSAYLGAVVPESADVHNVIGISLASAGKLEAAIAEFREALAADPDGAATHWHLGVALASRGANDEALPHLRRSVELDPENAQAQSDLGSVLALQGRLQQAIPHFQRALALDPGLEEARQKLEIALRAGGGIPPSN